MKAYKDKMIYAELREPDKWKVYKAELGKSLYVIYQRILQDHNIAFKDYYDSSVHYSTTNKYINLTISEYKIQTNFLNTIYLEFKKRDVSLTNFPEPIKDNYLKIVTNIFYLTAYQAFIDLKKDWYLNTPVEKNAADKYYQKHLKDNRLKVYEFFEIKYIEEINPKYLVRLYPYCLPEENPVKIQYFKQSDSINKLLDNLNLKICPDAFFSESVELNIKNVIL